MLKEKRANKRIKENASGGASSLSRHKAVFGHGFEKLCVKKIAFIVSEFEFIYYLLRTRTLQNHI